MPLSNQDYEDLGVEPPEQVVHGNESDQVLSQALNDHKHNWHVRNGNELYCDGGMHEHGHRFQPDVGIFGGTDDNGNPIFIDVKIVDNA